MNGLNISIMTLHDAIRYIKPETDKEYKLMELLNDCIIDLDKCSDYEEIKDERDDLKIDLSNAMDEIDALKLDIARLEREQ